MTNRELLIWLKPRLEAATATGLDRAGVRAIREELGRARETGALQPFASRLLTLVRQRSTLDAPTVAKLAGELRIELAPPREQTVLFSGTPERHDKR
jgi:hypothetical protein